MKTPVDIFHAMFGPVWDGAGARGFSGEGYYYHPLVPGLDFAGSTKVSKTITTYGTKGNMKLWPNYAPRSLFPDCIDIQWRAGRSLNAVGLSGPSTSDFLATGRWQRITDPFLFSFMPVLGKEDWRSETEVSDFISLLKKNLRHFRSRAVGVQVNITCPNAGVDVEALVAKAVSLVKQIQALGIFVSIKLNLLVPPEVGAMIARETGCSICIANTIPFGTVLPAEWWERNYRGGSPLAKRGYAAGGLSGPELLPHVARWVDEFRKLDSSTHVNAGGGILHARDVDVLAGAGASSIFFASLAMVRPWRVASVIERGHKLLG